MERGRVFLHSTFNIEHSPFNISRLQEEGLAVTRSPPRLPRKETSPECDDENQRGQRTDADPDPLLAGKAGGLHLVDVLRQLVKVLRRELGQTLIDLLLGEAAIRQDFGQLL